MIMMTPESLQRLRSFLYSLSSTSKELLLLQPLPPLPPPPSHTPSSQEKSKVRTHKQENRLSAIIFQLVLPHISECVADAADLSSRDSAG
jgi:hypothetical protein